MKNKKRNAAIIAGALATAAFGAAAQAQSIDSLLDKLVEKGTITVKEATELREKSDGDFTKAFQSKTSLPDWVTNLRFGGDLRLRYDGIYVDPTPVTGGANSLSDRSRLRYRLRFGAVATLQNDFEVGLRLISGENKAVAGATPAGDPISGNDTFSNNGSKKLVWIDQAYVKWGAVNQPDWSATFIGGKMENPFTFSEVVFDPDYTPEGGAVQLAYKLSHDQSLKLNGGFFSLSEVSGSSKDSYLFGAQLRWDSVWSPKWATSFGLSGLALSDNQNLATASVLDVNKGNTRVGGLLQSAMNPVIVDGAITYTLDSFPLYPGAFPIKLAGEYVNNPAANVSPLAGVKRNEAYSVGMTLGKSGKMGTWDLTYKYKNLEADYWYEEVVDSDHGAFYQLTSVNSTATGYGPGTNIRGHYMRAAYSPYDSLTLAVTYYLFNLIDKPLGALSSAAGRIQIDAAFKF